VKCSWLEHCAWYFGPTLLQGEQSYAARHWPHGRQLPVVSCDWYTWSRWIQWSMQFDNHYIQNSSATHTSQHDLPLLVHVGRHRVQETYFSRHLSIKVCVLNHIQPRESGGCSHELIPVNKLTLLNRVSANCRTVESLRNLQPNPGGYLWSRIIQLAVTY
jgi:hypothetical protein